MLNKARESLGSAVERASQRGLKQSEVMPVEGQSNQKVGCANRLFAGRHFTNFTWLRASIVPAPSQSPGSPAMMKAPSLNIGSAATVKERAAALKATIMKHGVKRITTIRRPNEVDEAERLKKKRDEERLLSNIRSGRNVCLAKKKKEVRACESQLASNSSQLALFSFHPLKTRQFRSLQDGARPFKSLFFGLKSDDAKDRQVRKKGDRKLSSLSGRLVHEKSRKVIEKIYGGVEKSDSTLTPASQRLSGRGSGRRRGSINKSLIIPESLIVAKPLNADGEWAVHPDDENYHSWYIITLFLVIYNSIVLPLDLMFSDIDPQDSRERVASAMFWFDTAIDCFFLLDLWITFHVGFTDDKGDIIVSKARISDRYIRGSFFIDLISSVPFDLIIILFVSAGGEEDNAGFMSYLALFKTFRLLRIGRLAKYMSDQGMVSFVRIFRILFIYLMLAHWGGCLFYIIMKNEHHAGQKTWLSEVGASMYKEDETSVQDFNFYLCSR